MEKSKLKRSVQKGGILDVITGENQEFVAQENKVIRVRRMTAKRKRKTTVQAVSMQLISIILTILINKYYVCSN